PARLGVARRLTPQGRRRLPPRLVEPVSDRPRRPAVLAQLPWWQWQGNGCLSHDGLQDARFWPVPRCRYQDTGIASIAAPRPRFVASGGILDVHPERSPL